ncbi:Tyrosinase co-factor MelC1 [Streptomyces misionensis]|uniref:Tyrosinase co-factor MelC1 n=1 Tax=Streptomyces misionensis TaxID=67331 RepID=A0A1H4VZ70_9ACTN|nr:tyrosinase family oxidase copper chaperone [Streptomyces misionensis]SEC86255.1 Tyrosinase co-factor MelC1 [Streptomyces misionensis]
MTDGEAVGARERARADTTAGPTRRRVARGLLSCAAVLSLAPVVAAARPVPPVAGPGGDSFDETYRGRHIRGVRMPEEGRSGFDADWRITVDGRPLHLMRRADGTWLSMVDHYTSYRTPQEAARAAVDELGPGQRLRDLAPGPLGHARSDSVLDLVEHLGMEWGDRHGVRA